MPLLPDRIDRALRALLRLPGLLVDLLDGKVQVQNETDPEQILGPVRRHAQHPEAYLALEEGLHHARDAAGRVLAWEVRGRTAFGIGGINAPTGHKAELLQAFAASTEGLGVVRQLVFPVRAGELEEARVAGFQPVQVGIEAWLDLGGLRFAGKRYANLRQMRNRARRRGVLPEEVAVASVAGELAEIHAAWLHAKRPSWRMKLLVGSPSLERPFDRRYLVARGPQRIEAFLTLLPGPEGVWGVDVMCRRPDAIPGSMERLLVHAVELLQEEGATALSLGPCPMAGVPFDHRRPWLSLAFRLLYGTRVGNQIFGFRSLVAFKDKLGPRWEPIHFAARPGLGLWALYRGCRMWGLY